MCAKWLSFKINLITHKGNSVGIAYSGNAPGLRGAGTQAWANTNILTSTNNSAAENCVKFAQYKESGENMYSCQKYYGTEPVQCLNKCGLG